MVDENKKKERERLKRRLKAQRNMLKTMTVAVGLSGAVAGHAETNNFKDPEPQAIEITQESQTDLFDTQNTISYEDAVAMAGGGAEQDYMTADEYAAAHGLVYSSRLSRGLDHYGDGRTFDGYAGAYVNPYAEMSNEQVIFLPNNMLYNRDRIRSTSMAYAQASQEGRTDMYFPNKYARQFERGVRVNPEVGRKVRKAVRVAENVLDIINTVGGHRR